jgi:hypothetical protein
VVKRKVYHPELGTAERREYLYGLARALTELLPADVQEGTISTLPIGHAAEVSPGAAQRAAVSLCHLCEDLARLADRSGRSIRVCIEPEAGCLLETTAQAIEFFTRDLPDAARRLGTDRALLGQHLGLCYDTCHQAVAFEDAGDSIRALTAAGITIGKAQLSSALELTDPSTDDAQAELAEFREPRFLHQVRAQRPDGSVAGVDDLHEIAALPKDGPWRVHFHVPIHRAVVGRLTTTRPFLEDALAAFQTLEPLPQLEVETYTWSVLPEHERPANDAGLVHGLAQELAWARGALI